MTPHNEAKIGEIAKTVLMPGDPLRSKYIADNFLVDVKQVNDIRNMYAYTGKYKGHEITIFPSGMGMPSMGIYSYELYKFYDVENIIRIGSCGSLIPELNLFDMILVSSSYTVGNFALTLTGTSNHIATPSAKLNNLVLETAQKKNIDIYVGDTCCTEIFSDYCVPEATDKRYPQDMKVIASEMEAFSLFSVANMFNKQASCILTVSDSKFDVNHISPDDREKSLNNMITLALDTSLKL